MADNFERFGKYALLEKLAAGGMAEVFLARSTGVGGIGKFVAIKRILPQYSDNKDFIRMFKVEARIAMNLAHSNVVSIYEFGVEKGQFFLVMEYVEGRNLRQILNKMKKKSSKFSVEQIVYIVNQIAAGLDHAHRCLDGTTGKPLNITHRDMSPQNVMLTFEGEIKIVDFGIAKAESHLESTRAGTLKGKFGYMSPEQAEGHPVDLRTDIFSLGIILWELLSNERLFIANNEINTLRKIRECQVPSLRKYNPNIHPELERITMKALARDKNLRYQTAAALHRDLNRFLNRQFPDFSPHDFAISIKTLFAEEILKTRKRLVEYAKASELTSRNSINDDSDLDYLLEQDEDDEKVPPGALDNAFKNTFQVFNQDGEKEPKRKQKAPLSPEITNTNQFEAQRAPDSEEDSILDTNAIKKETRKPFIPTGKNNSPIALDEHSVVTQGSTPSRYTITNFATNPQTSQKSQTKMMFAGILMIAAVALIGYNFISTPGSTGLTSTNPNSGVNPIPVAQPDTQPEAETPLGQPTPTNPNSMPTNPTTQPNNPDVVAQPNSVDTGDQKTSGPTKPVLILSKPSGAEIYVDGVNTNLTTPQILPLPSNRSFTLEIKRTGFVSYQKRNLQLTDIQGGKLEATLLEDQIAYLSIDVYPPYNARVFINGKWLKGERLPIRNMKVPANIQLRVYADNPVSKKIASQVIKLRKNQRSSVWLKLVDKTSSNKNKQ